MALCRSRNNVRMGGRRAVGRALLCPALLATFLLVGCSGSSSPFAGGHLSVSFREVGGPPPGINRPIAGSLQLIDRYQHPHNVFTSSGSVSTLLTSGTYRAVATSPVFNSGQSPCSGPETVTIRAGSTTHVAYTCDVP